MVGLGAATPRSVDARRRLRRLGFLIDSHLSQREAGSVNGRRPLRGLGLFE
jgi:hypothetical protein